MKIFLLEIPQQGYDTYDSHVIIAKTERTVITLAQEISADEGSEIWETATITELGDYKGHKDAPFIACSSFNAG